MQENNAVQRRRSAEDASSGSVPRASHQHDKKIDSNDNGNGNGNHRISSNRPMGSQRHMHSSKSNQGLVIVRIIMITIIILSIIWGYLLIQVTSSMNDASSSDIMIGPASALAATRPIRPDGKSRIGWMIQQKVNHMKLQLKKPVPLLDVTHMDSPLLIITFKRADYLERTLWKVYENHPAQKYVATLQRNAVGDASSIRGGANSNRQQEARRNRYVGAPIIVSHDGPNKEVQSVIESYCQLFEMKLGVPLYRIQHPRTNSDYNPNNEFAEDAWKVSYKLLAHHYGWALKEVFSGNAYNDRTRDHNREITPKPPLPQRVIILEEDIEIADDFFSLMNATADLLDSDDTLLAVSAFNDNGKEQLTANPKRLVRSDFFPGLGWMMSRNVWDGPPSHPGTGLKVNWAPNGFWDDWLREPNQRRGRQIIRPEVSRTFHFGNVDGVSAGENSNILNQIELEENNIQWEQQALSHLKHSVYDDRYWKRVSRARLVETIVEAKSRVAHSDVRLMYSDYDQFRMTAESFDIMTDEKAGVPRTAYEGIVEIRYGRGKYFIFLTPPYITEGEMKPDHFGQKAWKEYSKELLMDKLQIKNIRYDEPFNYDEPLDWAIDNQNNEWLK